MPTQRLREAHVLVVHKGWPIMIMQQPLENLAVACHFEDALEDHCAPLREAVMDHELGKCDGRDGFGAFFPEDIGAHGVLINHRYTALGKVVLHLSGDGGLPRGRVATEDHENRR